MSDTDELLDATTAVIPPLLNAIDRLSVAGRYLQPGNIAQLAGDLEPSRLPLQEGLERFSEPRWPPHLEAFVAATKLGAELALRSLDEFLSAPQQSNPIFAAYRATGFNIKATEAIYPLAHMLPPVSRFFMLPDQREDTQLMARLAQANPEADNVGVMHAANATDERGGFSLYVPEHYGGEAVPLVVTLHGGSGHGRSNLWTWLRTARCRNLIVISPTSQDDTWSLMGPDQDSERLHAIVEYAQEHWHIDTEHMLLTGMSDGGTFSYVSGLQTESPFTHLAPSSASFHPMLVDVADPQRLQNLPVYLMHGALDWMFPVDVARAAQDSLSRAGAEVTYREIEDLSHCYPTEENPRIVDWLLQH